MHADERLRDWAKQSKDMQRQLQELKRLKDEEKASQSAAIAEVCPHTRMHQCCTGLSAESSDMLSPAQPQQTHQQASA